jgi:predicted ArsR family transcriptional regulator
MYEEVYRALASKSRADILKLLYKKPHNIEELAEKLTLRPITVRHHIQFLMEAGLLESHEERSGTSGRPTNYYKIAKSLPIVNFPERHYLLLSSFLVDTILLNIGEQKTRRIIAKAGYEMGKEVVNQLGQKYNIKKWSPKEFAEIFIKGYLEETGTEPEIIAENDKRVIYRLHNCIFFELALKKPSLICDVLHRQFHQGVCTAIGKNLKDSQRTCMGHGDNFCEHVVEWT